MNFYFSLKGKRDIDKLGIQNKHRRRLLSDGGKWAWGPVKRQTNVSQV